MMIRIPPVPETGMPGKSVQVGSFNVFLYCTVYNFPFSVGKDRLKMKKLQECAGADSPGIEVARQLTLPLAIVRSLS